MIQLLVLASLVSTGFDMSYAEPVMEVLTGAETASKLSYRYDAGNVVSADRHVFEFDLKLASPLGWASQLASEPLSENFFTTGTVYRRSQPGSPNGWSGSESQPPPVFFVLWPLDPPAPPDWIGAEEFVAGGPNNPLGEFSPMYHSQIEDELNADAERPGNTSYEFYILSPGESGITMDPAVVPQGPSGALVTALGKPITDTDEIPCHLAGVGPLAGDEVRVLIKTTKTKYTLLGYQDMFSQPESYYYPYVKTYYLWKRTTSYHYALMTFDIQKLLCEDTSIDSRRIHGVPNAEGQLPGVDPNAASRNLNFNPWFFKGGLFIGKMGLSDGDQSGTARIQLYAQGVITEGSRLAVLSMVPLGPPRSGISSAMTVLSFHPATDDPYANSTNETVTWAQRWTPPSEGNAPVSSLEPATIAHRAPNPLLDADWLTGILAGSEPAMPDFAVHKIGDPLAGTRNQSSTGTLACETIWTPPGLSYRPVFSEESFTLPGGTPDPLVYANWQTGISATGTPAIPGFAVQKIGLKIASEEDSPSPVWCYFSSKEHEALNPATFPLNDSRPRIWLVNATITRWDIP